MEVLIHGIFTLFKISMLACIYATLTLLIFRIISHYNTDSWFEMVSKKKFRLWFLSGLWFSLGLFLFTFTYFGDHGLGDNARVPVGRLKVVRQINSSYTYLQNSNGEQLGISTFTFDSENLYGETERKFSGKVDNYVIWNLKTDNWTFYKTKGDYIKFAKQNNYPLPDKFEEFWNFYKRHWNGWRFWVLP